MQRHLDALPHLAPHKGKHKPRRRTLDLDVLGKGELEVFQHLREDNLHFNQAIRCCQSAMQDGQKSRAYANRQPIHPRTPPPDALLVKGN